jgi:hypothetical protein
VLAGETSNQPSATRRGFAPPFTAEGKCGGTTQRPAMPVLSGDACAVHFKAPNLAEEGEYERSV